MSPAAVAANMQTETVAALQATSEIAPLGAVSLFLNVVDMAALEGLAPVLSALAAPRGKVTLFVRISSAEMEAEVRRAVGGNAAVVRVGAPTSTAAALFSWSEEVDFRRFDLVLSLGDFTGGRRINAWLDNRLSFYVDNLVAGEGVRDAVARHFEDASIDMVMSPASPYLEGRDDFFWTKNRFEIRRMAADLGLRDLDRASNLHGPHSALWLRGEAAFALEASYDIVS